MIFCPKCLAALNDSDTICPACKTPLQEGVLSDGFTEYADQSTSTGEDPDGTRLISDFTNIGLSGPSAEQAGTNGRAPWSIASDPLIAPLNPMPSYIPKSEGDSGARYQQMGSQQASHTPSEDNPTEHIPIIISIIIALIIIAIAGFTFFTQEDDTEQGGGSTTQLETERTEDSGTNSSTGDSEGSTSEGMSTTTA